MNPFMQRWILLPRGYGEGSVPRTAGRPDFSEYLELT